MKRIFLIAALVLFFSVSVSADETIISGTSQSGGGSSVSDTIYGAGWNGDTTTAASKNAIYDKIETVVAGTTTASNVEVTKIGTATYDDIQDSINNIQSAGVISGGVLSDGGTGTLDISAVTGFIKTSVSEIGVSASFDVAAATAQVLTDSSINYVAVDYNTGTPQFRIDVTSQANGTTIFNLGKAYREGTSVDVLNSGLRVQDFSKRVQQHHIESSDLEFVSGAKISESAGLKIAITSGIMYAGINRIPTSAIDTNVADTFEYYYYNGTAWVEADAASIDSANYNDITSGLVAVGAARYGVHWVFKGTGTKSYVVYGQGSYTLSAAQALQDVPSPLPSHVDEMGVLRGKIIVAKDGTAFTEIESVNDTSFTSSTPSNHNELSALDGGTSGEYYHLTSSDYTLIAGDLKAPKASPTFTGTTNIPNLIVNTSLDIPGTIDFGSAESLEIPNAADPTVNLAGEIALDTTDDQLTYYGAAQRTLRYEEEVCVTLEDLAAADDNYAFMSWRDAVVITGVWCHYRGTGTTAATISLEDGAGNAMTHTVATCGVSTAAATPQAVTAANTLTAYEMLAFDVTNAVNPETDVYTICVSYTVTEQ